MLNKKVYRVYAAIFMFFHYFCVTTQHPYRKLLVNKA